MATKTEDRKCPGFCYDNAFTKTLHRLKQQRMYSWQPILTPIPVILMALLLGILCIILGIIVTVFSFQAKHSQLYRYDHLCERGKKCVFRFELDHDMDEPVYLYYRLENFYQNHRRYFKSKNYEQLDGNSVNDYDSLESCFPKISVNDDDDPESVFLPCGLQALSFFNDTFTLRKDSKKKVDQTTDDVAWHSDKRLYDDPGDVSGVRAPGVSDFEDETFMVWMKVAALPNFYKLYEVIEEDLDAGIYRMEINNNYPVHGFGGRKYFRLSTTNWLGGRNDFLGWAFIIMGAVLLILAVVFIIIQFVCPRKLGDPSYLEWEEL